MIQIFPYFFFFIFIIAATAYGIHQGDFEWRTVAAVAAAWIGFSLLIPFLSRWRIRVWRHREPVRATTARVVDGTVKTFYSAKARDFIVSFAAVLKERYAGFALPDPKFRAYRSDGVEHLEASWTAAGTDLVHDTVLKFRVDELFDDSWSDPNIIDSHIRVGDMVDAVVLVGLIGDAVKGLPPWNGTPIQYADQPLIHIE
jgi:hypothetical protein